MMSRQLAVVVLYAFLCVLGSNPLAAQKNEPQPAKQITYDRLEVLSRFLRTVYPDLSTEHGLSTLQNRFCWGYVSAGQLQS